MKSHVTYPKFFPSKTHAMQWFAQFVHGYNTIHLHSTIAYLTPQQRHTGEHKAILMGRQRTPRKAAQAHPERFVKGPRKMPFISRVYLSYRPRKVAQMSKNFFHSVTSKLTDTFLRGSRNVLPGSAGTVVGTQEGRANADANRDLNPKEISPRSPRGVQLM